MASPPRFEGGLGKLRAWINDVLVPWCLTGRPLRSVNCEIDERTDGSLIYPASGSATLDAASQCALGLYDATDDDGKKIGIRWGTIAGRQPTGFSAGGSPAYVLDVDNGTHYFFAKATADLDTLTWSSSEVVMQDDATPPASTTTEAYALFGSATVSDDGIILDFICGSIAMSVCNLPLT